MVDQLNGSCCNVWRTGTRHWTQTTAFMQVPWTLQKPLIAFTTAHFHLSLLMLAPSSWHWTGSRVTCPEGQSVRVSWMHCHQLAQSCQEYPNDLFCDLYFFSPTSKTFLPQPGCSQPSLPTTQCCIGRIAREAKTLHAVLCSLI